jgi:hemoglobin
MLKTSAIAAAALAAALALGACTTASAPPPGATLYERLGGRAAIAAVVDDAIANIAADPRINQRFSNAGVPSLTHELVELVCARSGGPCTYRGRDMSAAHEGMQIRDDEFDALVDDLARSLDKFKVPAREQRELLAVLGQMRNAVVGH